MPPEQDHDRYTPPPRHKERSGAIVRFAIVAALLGAAAWGYMEFAQQPQTALVEPASEERVADSSYDEGYRRTMPAESAAPGNGTPQSTTPAEMPQKADQPPA